MHHAVPFCDPPVAALPELLEALNAGPQESAFSQFVRQMRAAFRQQAMGSATPSMCDALAVMSVHD